MHIYDVHLYPALVLMDHFCIYKVTEVRAYKTSLTPPLFIEVSLPRQDSVLTVWYFYIVYTSF
jgi:hypothetical protein